MGLLRVVSLSRIEKNGFGGVHPMRTKELANGFVHYYCICFLAESYSIWQINESSIYYSGYNIYCTTSSS